MEVLPDVHENCLIIQFAGVHLSLALVECEAGVPDTWFSKIAVGGTVVLHLPGLIGTASHPDMRKVRVVGFLPDIRLRWQFEVEKHVNKRLFLGYIFI
jgi:hypothetical protein